MSLQITPKDDAVLLQFGPDLSVFTATEVHQRLLTVPSQPAEKVVYDLSAVHEFDSCGLQLLLWFIQHCPQKTVSWTHGDNPVVQRVLELYQLQGLAQ